MNIPRFLIADNSTQPEKIYVVHTDYPRFILDITTDEVEWLEEFDKEDEKFLQEEAEPLLQAAFNFYDREMENLEE